MTKEFRNMLSDENVTKFREVYNILNSVDDRLLGRREVLDPTNNNNAIVMPLIAIIAGGPL